MEKLFFIFMSGTWRRILCLLCILGCCSFMAFGQKRVSGTVTDANGEPLIGANVVEKGTTNGNITNEDGKFVLDVGDNAVLQISYVGYKTQEINTLTLGGGGTTNYQAIRGIASFRGNCGCRLWYTKESEFDGCGGCNK